MVIFQYKSIHFWDPSLNRVIMNRVIKRLKCITLEKERLQHFLIEKKKKND